MIVLVVYTRLVYLQASAKLVQGDEMASGTGTPMNESKININKSSHRRRVVCRSSRR